MARLEAVVQLADEEPALAGVHVEAAGEHHRASVVERAALALFRDLRQLNVCPRLRLVFRRGVVAVLGLEG